MFLPPFMSMTKNFFSKLARCEIFLSFNSKRTVDLKGSRLFLFKNNYMHSFIKRLELFFFILFMFVFNCLGFFELIKTCSIYHEQISLKYRVLNLKLVAKWLCSILILRVFNVKKSNLHFFFKWGKYLIIFWIFFHLSFQLKKDWCRTKEVWVRSWFEVSQPTQKWENYCLAYFVFSKQSFSSQNE